MMQKTLGVLAISISILTLGGCGLTEPPPFDPRRLAEIQKEAAQGAPVPEMGALPTTLPAVVDSLGQPVEPPPRATTRPIGATRQMTLQEVIQRAIANNLDVRVAGYQSAIDEVRILEAMARFDPTFFVNPQFQRQFPQGLFPGLTPAEIQSQSVSSGFRQQLASGAQAELRYQVNRTRFENTALGTFPPPETTIFDNALVAQITQPLLQNAGEEVNRARITVAQNDQKISQLEFRDQLEKLIQQIEETYWGLVLAQHDVEIQLRLLQDTENTRKILVRRLTNDTTMAEVAQARASVEQRNAVLVQARARVEDLSDDLKRLMTDPELPVVSDVTIIPADRPIDEPVSFALADQMETALQNRLELKEQNLRIDSAVTIVKAAKNNMLPKFDLQAAVTIHGLGENFDTAFNNQGELDIVEYVVGFQFEVPIGKRADKAIYQRTILDRQRAITQYLSQVEQVALEVKKAQRSVFTSWNLIIATRTARYAAEEALNAIEQRWNAGERLTAPFVQLRLDRQAALADTQHQEVQALTGYSTAISALEKAKGTLLRYNNVVLKEEAGPAFMQAKMGK